MFGGNTGSDPVNDAWCLNVEKGPFSWAKIACGSEAPPVRVYHSAAQCVTGSAAGMMVIFGGRTADQTALNDTWGLRKHRDNSWDWVKAPYKPGTVVPLPRYQHSSLFINSAMVVIGGRTTSVAKMIPLEVYDTETSEWYSFPPVKRFRHAAWSLDGLIYVHAGFLQDMPNVPTDSIVRIDSAKLFFKMPAPPGTRDGVKEETKAPFANTSQQIMRGTVAAPAVLGAIGKVPPRVNASIVASATMKSIQPKKLVPAGRMGAGPENYMFRLANQAHVAASFNVEDPESDASNFIRKVSIDQLQEESKKLAGNKTKLPVAEFRRNPNDSLCSMFLNHLLKPREYAESPIVSTFVFRKEYIVELAKECQALLESQPAVINLRTPAKIFGDIHGNFQDLMRMFDMWKSPTENTFGGDVDSVAYLFLGNYVDRGNRSLETICLLFALKLKYPDCIHLLRGNHEDRAVNALYGLGEECASRLHEDINDPGSVFQILNNTFAWLPLAALVENKIFCVHGGLAPGLAKPDDLLRVPRPVELDPSSCLAEQQMLLNVLWSDPAESEFERGFARNAHRSAEAGGEVMKYGADVVTEFLKSNGLEIMVRGHEVAMDGFDSFADSRLITVTSCTDYCGRLHNSACLLVVQKTFEIVPKLMLPSSEPASKSSAWIDDEEGLKKRPPTPARQRVAAAK